MPLPDRPYDASHHEKRQKKEPENRFLLVVAMNIINQVMTIHSD